MHKCLAHRLVCSDSLAPGSAGQRQHLFLHLSLDLAEKIKRQLSYTHINSPLTRREKHKHTISNAFLRDLKKKKSKGETLTPHCLLFTTLGGETTGASDGYTGDAGTWEGEHVQLGGKSSHRRNWILLLLVLKTTVPSPFARSNRLWVLRELRRPVLSCMSGRGRLGVVYSDNEARPGSWATKVASYPLATGSWLSWEGHNLSQGRDCGARQGQALGSLHCRSCVTWDKLVAGVHYLFWDKADDRCCWTELSKRGFSGKFLNPESI